ncbi:MAG: hypothetical protein ACD_52C00186G0003 [uncultured bacterium]|uniref:Uncharacterized protein n=1 Tax=Candidatus Woesebacteria bacterium RIFCSPHIGHO2_12_FULL_41_24 TaxID=1802510 RepID=A0A1F8ATY1_9BACT|nr:MAG: hypothetical protein ACD_52C00186G0003 [uncultured bacterium]OGM14130.1 MAG: hypothetical protein A2W15_03615 [Candidatus Woesebacteria bacterium RBG_16_41_13]OGM29616.1 MAG: hypothetical protein A2873_03640 [Candidatus Woesebacteria bacterium RIFCSPHIGHO2_01_FULL_42_80]OGM35592.1 MAG: hypothetical protein A3D84_03465 [Candidatus Woesebacteria bacterium RIFCSPHIGHO2_02_FULL_42_20]OGM55204.1 MAG: hypothetical protein A3E44_02875 [Candidatus Woesebacteria bacterium RIFCSPHIGHO2_12_FULL_41
MRKRIKVPGLVTIMALTLITAILWVGFEVIRIVIAKPNPDVPAEVLKELNPTLDAAQLDKLQGRVYLSEEEIDKFEIEPVPIQAPPPATVEPEEVSEESKV